MMKLIFATVAAVVLAINSSVTARSRDVHAIVFIGLRARAREDSLFSVHGRFLRSEVFLLKNGAILRDTAQI
jgi:hypothetical protein